MIMQIMYMQPASLVFKRLYSGHIDYSDLMDKNKILEDVGLSKNEAKVYVTLLKTGLTTIGEITKRSGVHRRNVYDSIDRLIEKGLAGSIIIEKKKYFEPTDPSRILNLVDEEKNKIRKISENVNLFLPELLHAHRMSKEKTGVIVRKGVKGIISVLDEVIRTKEENLIIGAHRPPDLLSIYLEGFHKKRIKAGIKSKLIFNVDDIKRAKKLSKIPFTDIRIMPKKYEGGTAINIFGDTVAILTWSDPMAIIIKDIVIAENFRIYFKLLWNVSRKP